VWFPGLRSTLIDTDGLASAGSRHAEQARATIEDRIGKVSLKNALH